MINIKLKDGKVIQFESGITVLQIAQSISDGLARVAVAAGISPFDANEKEEVSERLVCMETKIKGDCALSIYSLKDEQGQLALRHTAAHVLAMAVKNLYPTVKLGVGPAIEGGYYYDFDFSTPIKMEDLESIEGEMDRIIRQDLTVARIDKSRAEAGRILEAARDSYKLELLADIPRGEKITFYQIGCNKSNSADVFQDLCAGPHIPSLSKIKAFKLTKITGAYWKGDAKNKMLTRIYGVAFDKKSDLDVYNTTQEEIKRRDHNKIGREMELFTTVDIVGQGLPLLAPAGYKIMQILQRLVEDEEERRGYMHVRTPVMAKRELYKLSGHWDFYKDGMFVMGNELLDDEVFALRPMTCPFHFFLFKQGIRSYRELPIRYGETATLFRNESSGEMHGLTRVRQFTLSEGHIVCRPDQVHMIIDECINLANFMMNALGIQEKVSYDLSKWDPKNKTKYIGKPGQWEDAQEEIRKSLKRNKLKFVEKEGEAAFYGPKIDVQARNVYGKEDTMITVQLDFALAERYDMSYIDEKGEKKRPVIIHRTSIGSYERIIAFLIEHYAGAFPVWLSPVQCVLMGISNKQDAFVDKVYYALKAAGLRIEKDIRPEKVGFKIREHTLKKIPYMLVVGEKEEASDHVSIRTREGKELGTMGISEFIEMLKTQVKEFK